MVCSISDHYRPGRYYFLAGRWIKETDEFYKSVTPSSVGEDKAHVMRQALAGMLWSKQFFFFDGNNWLNEHNSNPIQKGNKNARKFGVVSYAE